MKCFVIMPFGDPSADPAHVRKLDQIYEEWIKPAVESVRVPGKKAARIGCHRADKAVRSGDIIRHVIEHLVTSDIVIADLTGKNPNVFYELGVRHAVSNNTILIAEDLKDIPFDLRSLRAISYQYDPEHMLKLKRMLTQAVKQVLSEHDQIDNPVRRFLYDREVDKIIKTPTPPGYDVTKVIINEMVGLKEDFARQLRDVRRAIEQVTSPQDAKTGLVCREDKPIKLLEGVWKNPETGSTYYARVVDGELRIPYCYEGDKFLTAHCYNCRLVGDTLFARFEWFISHISGYVFYRMESKDKAVGGWWYQQQVPSSTARDIARLDPSLPGMTSAVWVRQKRRKKFPNWAEEYFERVGKQRKKR